MDLNLNVQKLAGEVTPYVLDALVLLTEAGGELSLFTQEWVANHLEVEIMRANFGDRRADFLSETLDDQLDAMLEVYRIRFQKESRVLALAIIKAVVRTAVAAAILALAG